MHGLKASCLRFGCKVETCDGSAQVLPIIPFRTPEERSQGAQYPSVAAFRV